LKVLILNNDFRVYWKGRLIYLRKFLAAKGIELYATELFGKGSPYSFDSYRDTEDWWTCLFADHNSDELSKKEIAKNLFAKLDKIDPDIIIACPVTFFAGALGIRWAKQHKKKFIMFDDAKLAQFKRNFLVQTVKDLIIKQSDGLWLPSAEYYEDYNRLNSKNILFFNGYSCIDNSRFKFKEAKNLNYHTIICVARLVPIKNIDNLLRAWQLIEQENVNYKLKIIGDGPGRNDLNRLSQELGLKNVEFAGTIDNDELPSHLYQSDALILPSLSETWGLVVNEAMAGGMPVLLSNKVNACESLLKEGVNGYSFDPLNINQMATAILKFIKLTEAEKSEMSAQSLIIIDTMSYENMGQKLVDAMINIEAKKFKKPGLLAGTLIKRWYGKDDRSAWDKL